MWKVCRKRPGNGTTRRNWQCNSHKDCPVVMKLSQAWGGHWQLVMEGTHALQPQELRRANARLTIAQERHMQASINEGATPGNILTSMTVVKLAEYKELGIDPMSRKREEGGLTGCDTYVCACCVTVCVRLVGVLGLRWRVCGWEWVS